MIVKWWERLHQGDCSFVLYRVVRACSEQFVTPFSDSTSNRGRQRQEHKGRVVGHADSRNALHSVIEVALRRTGCILSFRGPPRRNLQVKTAETRVLAGNGYTLSELKLGEGAKGSLALPQLAGSSSRI